MNWKNSNFQILYHVVFNCRTYTEAARVLSELRQDRVFAIESSMAESKRSHAKVLLARGILSDDDESPVAKVRAVCDIEEQEARVKIATPCFEAAMLELAFIDHLLTILHKHGVPMDQESFQRVQPVENAYDLIVRAHADISLSGMPSPELLNESRNSPYREQVIDAIYTLMDQVGKISDRKDRIKFLSMSAEEILACSGCPVLADHTPLIQQTFVVDEGEIKCLMQKNKEDYALTTSKQTTSDLKSLSKT